MKITDYNTMVAIMRLEEKLDYLNMNVNKLIQDKEKHTYDNEKEDSDEHPDNDEQEGQDVAEDNGTDKETDVQKGGIRLRKRV